MSPEKTKNGLTFFPIPEFDDVSSAFGADEDRYFNRMNLPDIPSKYEDIVSNLFFSGGKLPELLESVDTGKAMKAMQAWLSSHAPAHEAKIATAAYAIWVWSEADLPVE